MKGQASCGVSKNRPNQTLLWCQTNAAKAELIWFIQRTSTRVTFTKGSPVIEVSICRSASVTTDREEADEKCKEAAATQEGTSGTRKCVFIKCISRTELVFACVTSNSAHSMWPYPQKHQNSPCAGAFSGPAYLWKSSGCTFSNLSEHSVSQQEEI